MMVYEEVQCRENTVLFVEGRSIIGKYSIECLPGYELLFVTMFMTPDICGVRDPGFKNVKLVLKRSTSIFRNSDMSILFKQTLLNFVNLFVIDFILTEWLRISSLNRISREGFG